MEAYSPIRNPRDAPWCGDKPMEMFTDLIFSVWTGISAATLGINTRFRDFENVQNISIPVSNQPHVGLGSLGVTCTPRGPRFARSNSTEVDGFFQDVKILSTCPPGGTLSWGFRSWGFRLVKEPQAWKNRPMRKIYSEFSRPNTQFRGSTIDLKKCRSALGSNDHSIKTNTNTTNHMI